jgi:hypothetical protein
MLVVDAGAVKYLLPKLVIGGTYQSAPPALARQHVLSVIERGAGILPANSNRLLPKWKQLFYWASKNTIC